MKKAKCTVCKARGLNGYTGRWIDDQIKYWCPNCKSQMPGYGELHITDATGAKRDRVWLNHKLEMTRTEANWHRDIMSRRIAKDGTVYREDKK